MPNPRVTPRGQAMGKNATRLAALGLQRLQAYGLADVQAPMLRTDMCKTCACQPNTVPNGCLQTQLDFLKSAAEGRPFLCHAPKDGRMCAGWVRAAESFGAASRAMLAAIPADLADTLAEASQLLQHSNTALTEKHYRTEVQTLRAVR